MNKKLSIISLIGFISILLIYLYLWNIIIGDEYTAEEFVLFLLIFFIILNITFGLLSLYINLKTNLFSDINLKYKTPVYKLQSNIPLLEELYEPEWKSRSFTIRKYIISYKRWDNIWVLFFPLLYFFKFKICELDYDCEITIQELESILKGNTTLEETVLRIENINLTENEKYKQRQLLLKKINADYYNNFK